MPFYFMDFRQRILEYYSLSEEEYKRLTCPLSELTPEVRKETMVKAIGKSASAMFAFMLINLYIVINFFGFGVENTALLFASAMIGEVVAVIALLCVAGPLANGIEKLFSKIHLPKIKWFSKDNKPKQVTRRNSSEPEETIFIGIND